MSSLNLSLPRRILEVITYFDLFAYPLTALEIWINLQTKAEYGEVVAALEYSRWLRNRLLAQNGRWCLKGSEACFRERDLRYRASKHKLDQARRFVRLLRYVPAIEGVYGCNSLGFLQSKPESDIDLFIVARRGRIWSARFFAVLLAELTGFRPKRAHTKDGLCLSFFAADGADMQKLAMDRDIYYLYWMSKLLPLLSRNGIVERFWVRNRFVHAQLPQMQALRTPASVRTHQERKVKRLRSIGDVFERAAHSLQIRIMPGYLKDAANRGTAVVVSEEFLKFHDHDRRAYFRDEFFRRLAALGA